MWSGIQEEDDEGVAEGVGVEGWHGGEVVWSGEKGLG